MIHIVIGTRAQLLKMAPIMVELEKRKIAYRWIYTAQHKETMSELMSEFGLPEPDYTVVKWNTEAKTMGKIWRWFFYMIAGVLFNKKKILGGYTGRQSVVLTHGDTISTWWGALLGKLAGCKVMHIESGLRSFNVFEPFPEEINRLITFVLSDYYACPGKWAMDNLKKYHGVKFNTQMNTQIDTLLLALKNIKKSKYKLPNKKYVVVSIHRYENIFKKERFKRIIEMLLKISEKFQLIIVQHPATKIQLEKQGYTKLIKKNKIDLIPRLSHLDFIKFLSGSEFVITDGGGNQEELYHMGKPTLLFRESTERKEGLGKTALLSGLNEEKVLRFVDEYKKYKQKPVKPKVAPTKIIVDNLEKFGFK